MRYDNTGLFWSNNHLSNKIEFLKNNNWSQLFPGYWIDNNLLKTKNSISQSLTLAEAYKYVRSITQNIKKEPPEPVWLKPDYLPGLNEAIKFDVPLITDNELLEYANEINIKNKKHILVYDIEIYPNFLYIGFKSVFTGKCLYFEKSDYSTLDINKLKWVFDNFQTVGFNSIKFDNILIALILDACSITEIKEAADRIIIDGEQGWQILRSYKVKKLKIDHIDIMEVAPLFASLKIYGGRLNTHKMQDLPFPANTVLSKNQQAIVGYYCINDLMVTLELYKKLIPQLELRAEMSKQYKLDLRSKSDAQIAETVIKSQLRINNFKNEYHDLSGHTIKYKVPDFLTFKTSRLQNLLDFIKNTSFIIGNNGKINLPDELKTLKLEINNTIYSLGIGGLHSNEKYAAHIASENIILKDVDVTSYYPYIILNQDLYPIKLGPRFLVIYRDIVERRVAAKRSGNKTEANSLKIVINGSFGKFGSPYSILYSPDLLLQVTLTGQLSLLMLIELLELSQIPVVSANTDGIVIKCPDTHEKIMNDIINFWEKATDFNTEETAYKGLFSRDVNNYIAIKQVNADIDKSVKVKGIFSTPGLSKNPQNEICIIAIKQFLVNNIPIESTIKSIKTIYPFLTVRTVKGGAVKLNENLDNEYLGKAVRWYYAINSPGEIVYAKSGNKVPRSENACPIMEIPAKFPDNIDYDWYINEANDILKNIGFFNIED